MRRLLAAILMLILFGIPGWLFFKDATKSFMPGAAAAVWTAADMCVPDQPEATSIARSGLPSNLDFFTAWDSYMPRTQCMVTQTGETDWFWVGLLLFFNAVIVVGYVRIFLFWRRSYLAEQERDRNNKLMDLAWIFLFCAVCGYVSSIVLFFWPAYRLLAIMLIPLGFFTWRFAWNLEPFKVALSAKRYRRELHEELERRNEELERRVELATAKMQEAVVEANRANETKSRFLANMSHEIRTPMTAIIGFCEAISKDGQIDTQSRKHLDIVQTNGEHLLGVVNDILDHAKLESGEVGIEWKETELRLIAEGVVAAISPEVERKGNALDLIIDSALPQYVMTDPTRLWQILLNLTSNANKFTSRGAIRVCLRASSANTPDEHTLAIEVEDSGVGMSPEQSDRCFAAFTQADISTKRVFGGTGLGLTIARDLARAMGGDVSVDSKLGRGTTFLATVRVGLTTERSNPQPTESVSETQLVRLDGLSVLYVDDSKDNRRLVKYWVSRAGAEVTTSEDGCAGAELAIQRWNTDTKFDVILMDLHMPGMNGIEAIRSIRDGGVETPIIILSADVMPEGRADAVAAGGDMYITKPVDFPKLINRISKIAESDQRDAA